MITKTKSHQIEYSTINVEGGTILASSHGMYSHKDLKIITSWNFETDITAAFYRVFDHDKMVLETASFVKAIAAYNQIS